MDNKIEARERQKITRLARLIFLFQVRKWKMALHTKFY